MPDLPAIILYARRDCPNCQAARAFLVGLEVPFAFRDVQEDEPALRELTGLTGKAVVPTVVVGDDVQIGWDQSRVADMVQNPLPPEEDDNLLAFLDDEEEPPGEIPPDPDAQPESE
jgi:glutaredoxin